MRCCISSKYLVKFNSGNCLIYANDYNGAVELYGQALTAMRQALPADHVDVAMGELETCLNIIS